MWKEWSYIIDIPPLPTPPPNFTTLKPSHPKLKNITYYPQKYNQYITHLQHILNPHNPLNNHFYHLIPSPYPLKPQIKFFLQPPKPYKPLNNIITTTPPHIHNFQKPPFHTIFKPLQIKHTPIPILPKPKFQHLHTPTTQITFKPIQSYPFNQFT